MMFPAYIGAKSPAKLAKQFVNAIKIPANRGEISKWLTLKPEYMPPLRPTPIVSRATVSHRSHPVNDAATRATAGPYSPGIKLCCSIKVVNVSSNYF